MAFLPRLSAQIYEFADKVKAALGRFFGKMAEKAEALRIRAQFGFDRLTGGLSSGKQRVVVFAIAGVLAVLLAVIVGMAVSSKSRATEQETAHAAGSGAATAAAQPGIIPPEDVFLPEEPDFVPGVILDREQRAEWAASDAEPLWQDPLKNGEEPWRDRIEKAIDEIMGGVQ